MAQRLFLWLFLFCRAGISLGLKYPEAFASCYNGDSDCPPCPGNRTESFTSTIYLGILGGGFEMINNVRKAQDIIKTFEENQDIIEIRPLAFLHTTLNYFCCHTPEEKEEIVSIMQKFPWSAHNLTYDNVSCNLEHDGVTIYLLAIPDAASQAFLFQWVHGIEDRMREAGIPVNNPRKQPFHCTMALVDHRYPVDNVVTLLRVKVPDFSTVDFSEFFVDGHWIEATND